MVNSKLGAIVIQPTSWLFKISGCVQQDSHGCELAFFVMYKDVHLSLTNQLS